MWTLIKQHLRQRKPGSYNHMRWFLPLPQKLERGSFAEHLERNTDLQGFFLKLLHYETWRLTVGRFLAHSAGCTVGDWKQMLASTDNLWSFVITTTEDSVYLLHFLLSFLLGAAVCEAFEMCHLNIQQVWISISSNNTLKQMQCPEEPFGLHPQNHQVSLILLGEGPLQPSLEI